MLRAEKHLVDLNDAIGRYFNSDPYEVRSRREGKKKVRVHRLHFTAQPDPMVGLIAADFIYNIRSGLDHLMAAIVPSKDRDSVMFPIFFDGVWGPSGPGENPERTKARERWTTCTRNAAPDAVTYLKRLQPTDEVIDDPKTANLLIALNRLSNTDRHKKLPVVSAGLTDVKYVCRLPNETETTDDQGMTTFAAGIPENWIAFLQDEAQIMDVPEDAMEVQLYGTPLVAVRIGQNTLLPLQELVTGIMSGALGAVQVLREFTRGTPR
jgi:hypothetical protein